MFFTDVFAGNDDLDQGRAQERAHLPHRVREIHEQEGPDLAAGKRRMDER